MTSVGPAASTANFRLGRSLTSLVQFCLVRVPAPPADGPGIAPVEPLPVEPLEVEPFPVDGPVGPAEPPLDEPPVAGPVEFGPTVGPVEFGPADGVPVGPTEPPPFPPPFPPLPGLAEPVGLAPEEFPPDPDPEPPEEPEEVESPDEPEPPFESPPEPPDEPPEPESPEPPPCLPLLPCPLPEPLSPEPLSPEPLSPESVLEPLLPESSLLESSLESSPLESPEPPEWCEPLFDIHEPKNGWSAPPPLAPCAPSTTVKVASRITSAASNPPTTTALRVSSSRPYRVGWPHPARFPTRAMADSKLGLATRTRRNGADRVRLQTQSGRN